MGGRQARRLCPQAIVVPARMAAYSEASKAVFAVFEDTTLLVEGLSIDEAFLDVRGLERLAGQPLQIAARLRERILDEVGLPITVGIARTKPAKVASAVAKPNGLLVVPPTTSSASSTHWSSDSGVSTRDGREAPRPRGCAPSARSHARRGASSPCSAEPPDATCMRSPTTAIHDASRRRRSPLDRLAAGSGAQATSPFGSSTRRSSPSWTASREGCARPKAVSYRRSAAQVRRLHARDEVADDAAIDRSITGDPRRGTPPARRRAPPLIQARGSRWSASR